MIPFKIETGLTKGVPYIDMRECKEGFRMIQTVRNNFYKFTGKNIEKAKLSHKMQSMVAKPPYERFKEILIGSSLKNFPVEVKDFSNSCAIFGANRNRLRGASTR